MKRISNYSRSIKLFASLIAFIHAPAFGMTWAEAKELCDIPEYNRGQYDQCMDSVLHNDDEPSASSYPSETVNPSQGSCFFISPDGSVATSYHVIIGKSEYIVIDNSGAKFQAALVKHDPANDIAVLKVGVRNHKYLSTAPFGSLKTGQEVFVVGYPASAVLGIEPKFTDGSVSSTTGPQGMANMFQMSVPIQPGNSGGPVLNEKGQVVGIVASTAAFTFFLDATGTLPQNVNWAVKSEYLSILAGIPASKSTWGSRQAAIDAAIGALCMVKAQ